MTALVCLRVKVHEQNSDKGLLPVTAAKKGKRGRRRKEKKKVFVN